MYMDLTNHFITYVLYKVKNLIKLYLQNINPSPRPGGRRSPAVACWASDHWVASSNPLRGKFPH